jgi:hypothetical protein
MTHIFHLNARGFTARATKKLIGAGLVVGSLSACAIPAAPAPAVGGGYYAPPVLLAPPVYPLLPYGGGWWGGYGRYRGGHHGWRGSDATPTPITPNAEAPAKEAPARTEPTDQVMSSNSRSPVLPVLPQGLQFAAVALGRKSAPEPS